MPQANVFQRPSHGSILDVSELEYVSALHQSSHTSLRADGTISSRCVTSLLRSRHGVEVCPEYVDSDIIGDLAGDPMGGSEAEKVLDVVQLCALLLVPFLKEEAVRSGGGLGIKRDDMKEEENEEENDGGGGVCMERVVEIMKRDLGYLPSDKVLLTSSVLRELLGGYGETRSCPHGIDYMLRHAREATGRSETEDLPLDANTLLRALTFDLDLYDAGWKDSHSTHWADFLSTVEGGMSALNGLKGNDSVHNSDDDQQQQRLPSNKPTSRILRLGRNSTLTTIDLTADSFRSDLYFILLFLSMIITYLAYAKTDLLSSTIRCSDNFFCEVGKSILSWLVVFTYLGLCGGFFIFFASPGNSAACDCPHWAKIMGCLLVIAFIILPFWNYGPPYLFRDWRDGEGYLVWSSYSCLVVGFILVQQQLVHILGGFFPQSKLRKWINSRTLIRTKERHTKRAAGFKTEGIVRHALSIHAMGGRQQHQLRVGGGGSSGGGDGAENTEGFVDPGSTSAAMTVLQRKHLGAQNEALLNFAAVHNDEPETIGGFRWFWKGGDCSKEGIWISARILASQIGQLIALFAFAFLFSYLLKWIDTDYDDETQTTTITNIVLKGGVRSVYFNDTGSYVYSSDTIDESFLRAHDLSYAYDFDTNMGPYVETRIEKIVKAFAALFAITQEATTVFGYDTSPSDLLDRFSKTFYDTTGLNLADFDDYFWSIADYDGTIASFMVSRVRRRLSASILRFSLAIGGSFGILAVLSTTLAFLPSYASLVLRFRSGVGPSPLTNPGFLRLKQSQWEPVQLFGKTFWSATISGIAVALLTGGIAFLFVWDETQRYATIVFAGAIGVLVSWVLKRTVLILVQKQVFNGFYRRNLVLGNLVTVIMEAWHIGLTLGFVLARAGLAIASMCVYVGRSDTPLLAPGVNFFGLTIDENHTSFYADLLLHEAHRHPYIERLALLYLLKIHHGNRFLVLSGSRWRLLFVLALVPWLRKYRAREMRLTDVDRMMRENDGEKEEEKIL